LPDKVELVEADFVERLAVQIQFRSPPFEKAIVGDQHRTDEAAAQK